MNFNKVCTKRKEIRLVNCHIVIKDLLYVLVILFFTFF